jgi:Tol biopolymer transport system component
MNVDGSDLQQLTDDGAQKTRLHWLPDGTALTYISGKCAWQLDYQTGRQDFLACFESARYLDEFIVSHDGSRAAISLNLELFVVPFDRDRLMDARSRSDLIAMSDCEVLNPLTTNTGASVAVTQVRWSKDDTKLALKVLAPQNGIQVDLIRYTDISSCQYTNKLDEFPASRFHIDGYDKTPYIQNFGFDGEFLFAMNSYTRNDGYGYLYIYNTDLHRADSKISPVGNCCYRDPQFSPDGRYIIFAYQPFVAGAATQLYYVPYAQLTTGADFEPIPLPEGIFANPKVKPMPVLRPANGDQ